MKPRKKKLSKAKMDVIKRELSGGKITRPKTPTLSEMAIQVIDHLLCSDFMEDLAMSKPRGKLKTAYLMLSDVYELAHGSNQANSCYRVHTCWRDELQRKYALMIIEEAKVAPPPES